MNTAGLIIIGIALANNLDNLGVGVAYGIARIRVPTLANLWISAIGFIITAGAVIFGGVLAHVLPGRIPNLLSALILCLVGLWVMISPTQTVKEEAPRFRDRYRSSADGLKLILHDPLQADRDGSRHIDFLEATFLGLAVSINNIGGGLTAGLLHLNAIWIALLSAGFSYLAIWLGARSSSRLAGTRTSRHASVLAGFLLVAIGLIHLR